MARIEFGPLVANARGKVGGGVFTRAKSGAVLRIRVKPRNPRSDAQSGVRAYLTSAARAFKALGATDLALWNGYAGSITKHNKTTGQAYTPSAMNIFTELAAKFLQLNPAGTIPSAPPTSPYVEDATTVTAAGGSGIVTFTASADAVSGSTLECLLQPLKSANRTPTARGYRTEGFSIVAHGTPKVISHLSADYLHPSSPIPAGVYVPAYRFCHLADGQVGQLHVLPAVTVT